MTIRLRPLFSLVICQGEDRIQLPFQRRQTNAGRDGDDPAFVLDGAALDCQALSCSANSTWVWVARASEVYWAGNSNCCCDRWLLINSHQ